MTQSKQFSPVFQPGPVHKVPELLKLFSQHGAVYVDAAQLAKASKTHLTIYTAKGQKLSDTGRSKEIREQAGFGVHRENLFATQELADAAGDKIYREIFGEHATPVKELRSEVSPSSRMKP
jgi:hypothetical protein